MIGSHQRRATVGPTTYIVVRNDDIHDGVFRLLNMAEKLVSNWKNNPTLQINTEHPPPSLLLLAHVETAEASPSL